MSPLPAPRPHLLPAHWIPSPEPRTRSCGFGPWVSPGFPILSGSSRQDCTASTCLHQVQPVCSLIRAHGGGPGTPPAADHHAHAVVPAFHGGHCGEHRMGGRSWFRKGCPGVAIIWAQLSPSPCCTSSAQPQYDGSNSFLLFDDESDGVEEEELMDKDEEEEDDSEISGCGGVPFSSEDPWLWARALCPCPRRCLITVHPHLTAGTAWRTPSSMRRKTPVLLWGRSQ